MRLRLRDTALVLSAAFAAASGPIASGQQPTVQEQDDSVGAIENDFYSLLRKASAKQQASPPALGGFAPPLLTDLQVVGFVDRAWKIYDSHEGEPEEFDALVEVMKLSLGNYSSSNETLDSHWRNAAAKLFASFLDDDRMAQFAASVMAPKKMEREAKSYHQDLKSKSKSVSVQAAFAYADLAPEVQAALDGQLDAAKEKATLDRLAAFRARYAERKDAQRGQTYGSLIDDTTFAIQNLKVGGTAPEIAASDLDGVAFKLSDYRGKVVLLDFWGYW